MDEAKEHMRQCLEALKEEVQSPLKAPSSVPEDHAAVTSAREQTILQSYERLRRELGLAVRECERGKAALHDILEARRKQARDSVKEDEEDEENMHGLSRGSISGSSGGEMDDKLDAGPKTPDEGSPIMPSLAQIMSSQSPDTSLVTDGTDFDDVTQHLLLSTSSSHLPAPGIEQVFEAESGAAAAFRRERSKLSREERIKLAKAKRESKLGSTALGLISEEDDLERDRRRGWGPSTEVVAELKDVIWKVGERRRRMMSTGDLETVVPSEADLSRTSYQQQQREVIDIVEPVLAAL